MAQPLFPSTISAQLPSVESLTIKTMVRKIHQNNAHTGSSCLDKACLDRGGGGGIISNHITEAGIYGCHPWQHTCTNVSAGASASAVIPLPHAVSSTF